MSASRVVVVGGGFAGLWSAVGAARKLDELGLGPQSVRLTLINRDAFHSIRVRNYEEDLASVRVPLDDVLGPIGVERIEGEVTGIDLVGQHVAVTIDGKHEAVPYDRLVFALGSQVVRPNLPGLAAHGFDVDTYDGAARLNRHLELLPDRPASPGQFTVVVVGAGLTGIEAATEMPRKLRSLPPARPFRVILADHKEVVGSDMGASARPVIEEALAALNIETRLGIEIAAIGTHAVTLASGEELATDTVVWCAGMRAHPLTRMFPVEHDRFGRIPVDVFMRVRGVPNVFAAGDVATVLIDETHPSVMSCQHGRPMGRFAGHNVICHLLGLPTLALRIDWYVTVLDLGDWGAVYTEGWDRHVVTRGEAAKKTKQLINRQRIYPPLDRNRRAILDAAAPVVQQAPKAYH